MIILDIYVCNRLHCMYARSHEQWKLRLSGPVPIFCSDMHTNKKTKLAYHVHLFSFMFIYFHFHSCSFMFIHLPYGMRVNHIPYRSKSCRITSSLLLADRTISTHITSYHTIPYQLLSTMIRSREDSTAGQCPAQLNGEPHKHKIMGPFTTSDFIPLKYQMLDDLGTSHHEASSYITSYCITSH